MEGRFGFREGNRGAGEAGDPWAGASEELKAKLESLALSTDSASSSMEREKLFRELDENLVGSIREAFFRDVAKGGVSVLGGEFGEVVRLESGEVEGDGGREMEEGAGASCWWEEGSWKPRPFAFILSEEVGESGSSGGALPRNVSGGERLRPVPPPMTVLRPSGPPSPALSFAVLNFLYAYCHTYILFAGNCDHSPLASSQALLALSSPLARSDAHYPTARAACHAALEAGNSPRVRLTPLPSPALTLDILHRCVAAGLLRTPRNVQDAILDAREWLIQAKEVCVCVEEGEGVGGGIGGEESMILERAAKKLWFYASWSMGLRGEQLEKMREEVMGVCEEGMASLVGDVAGKERSHWRASRGGSEAEAIAAPSQSLLSDLLNGRLLQRRDTLKGLPAVLKFKSVVT